MANIIGQTPQYTPSVVQNSPQQNAAKQQVQAKVAQDTSDKSQQVVKNTVGNVQEIAKNILAQRAESSGTTQPDLSRGQVIDIVV